MPEENAGARGARGDRGNGPNRRQGQGWNKQKPAGRGTGGKGGDRGGSGGQARGDQRGTRRFDDKRGRDHGGRDHRKQDHQRQDNRDRDYKRRDNRGQDNRGKPNRPGTDRGGEHRNRENWNRENPRKDKPFQQKPDRKDGGKTHGRHGEKSAPRVANRKPNTDRARYPEPALPEEIKAAELDGGVRKDLLGLAKEMADKVGKHLVAAGKTIDEDPAQALEHARFARSKASRLAVVREACGLAAYHAGEWQEAISELRAYRRMTGAQVHLAILADCERALARPQRALDIARDARGTELDKTESVELRIVAAGARRDLGQIEAAVVDLQGNDLDPNAREPWSARLFYAYADNLLAAGRAEEAVRWFMHAADADFEELTDAPERALEVSEALSEPDPEHGP